MFQDQTSQADLANAILRQLPPNTNHYQSLSLEDFESRLWSEIMYFDNHQLDEASQFVLFSPVNSHAFEILEDNESSFPRSTGDYYPAQELLVTTIPCGPQGIAHNELSRLLDHKLRSMNSIDKQLLSTGGATVHSKFRSKDPDSAFQPRDLPQWRLKKWPTLVLETGYYHSPKYDILHDDARYWLLESGGNIKIFVSICVYRKCKEIYFRSYYRGASGEIDEHLVIVKQPNDHGGRVYGGPLVIPFKGISLREPVGSSGKVDIIFTKEGLRYLADSIWWEQFP